MDRTAAPRSVGEKVQLIGLDPSFFSLGSLNARFLWEEGVRPETRVPIVSIEGQIMLVTLPSGYSLYIKEKDIAKGGVA